VVEEVGHIQELQPDNLTGAYVLAVVPARYVMERNNWAAAAGLTPRPSAFPYTEALTYWARAMGSARTGDVAAARQNLNHLQSIEKKLNESKENFWATQTEVLVREASAWIAQAASEKNQNAQQDEIVRLMRSAADLEDSMDKHPISPGPVLPARELLGELLLELHRLAEASAAFEVSLRDAPNRFNSLFGAAKSAELAGDGTRARQYYAKLIENCSTEQASRSQLSEAKTYLAKR
jgi:tetratricopeptide (TPR) repeat protein